MTKLKILLFVFSLSLTSFFILAKGPEELKPIPMPLHGVGNGQIFSAPEPHREEAIKKWLIPSVRIRVTGAAGSGTICKYDSTTNTAFVISCAHLYDGGAKPTTIEVFYKNDQKLASPQKFEAKVISFKKGYYADDISFLSFTPDWVPQTWFPIAPVNHPIATGEQYFSCGCDGASEVALYYVRPQGINGAFLSTHENSPRPGRSGGGLMDKDGWYVGICVRTSKTDGSGTGFFVHLKTIHDYCKANSLDYLLNVPKPNDLLRMIPIVDRNNPQGIYPPDYISRP